MPSYNARMQGRFGRRKLIHARIFGAPQTWIETMKIRKFYTFVEDTVSEAGKSGEPLLRKVAAVAVVENPDAGCYVEDLKPMVEASEELGRELSKIVMQALGPYRAQSYGKGGIVGLAGEQEYINLCHRTIFCIPLCAQSRSHHNAHNAGIQRGNNATFTPPKMVLCSFTGCLFHDDVPSGQCPVVKLPRSAHSANCGWKTQPYCSGSKTARRHARFLGNLESSHWEIS